MSAGEGQTSRRVAKCYGTSVATLFRQVFRAERSFVASLVDGAHRISSRQWLVVAIYNGENNITASY